MDKNGWQKSIGVARCCGRSRTLYALRKAITPFRRRAVLNKRLHTGAGHETDTGHFASLKSHPPYLFNHCYGKPMLFGHGFLSASD